MTTDTIHDSGVELFRNRLSSAMRSIPTGNEHTDLREGIEHCLNNIKSGAPRGEVYKTLIEAAAIFTRYMVDEPQQAWQLEVARAFAGDEDI